MREKVFQDTYMPVPPAYAKRNCIGWRSWQEPLWATVDPTLTPRAIQARVEYDFMLTGATQE